MALVYRRRYLEVRVTFAVTGGVSDASKVVDVVRGDR